MCIQNSDPTNDLKKHNEERKVHPYPVLVPGTAYRSYIIPVQYMDYEFTNKPDRENR